MDLFNDLFDGTEKILPIDGEVNFYGQIYTDDQALFLSNELLHHIPWEHDQAVIFGKLITTKRKYAWYGDIPFQYRYSKITKVAKPWMDVILEIKNKVEELTQETFNSCLLNLYHNGEEGMSWHSDAEKRIKRKWINRFFEFWS